MKPCQIVWENTDHMLPQVSQAPGSWSLSLGCRHLMEKTGVCLGPSKATKKLQRTREVPRWGIRSSDPKDLGSGIEAPTC